MEYQLAGIDPKELKKLKVSHQDQIKELTGEEFDPVKAYELIKKESKDFKQDHKKAKEADRLFYELFNREVVSEVASGVVSGMVSREVSEKASGANNDEYKDIGTAQKKRQISIRERERTRHLELLELELELAA